MKKPKDFHDRLFVQEFYENKNSQDANTQLKKIFNRGSNRDKLKDPGFWTYGWHPEPGIWVTPQLISFMLLFLKVFDKNKICTK